MVRMKILFVHPNFPAQFRHMAAALGRAEHRHEVVFLTAAQRRDWSIPGVRTVRYAPDSCGGALPQQGTGAYFARCTAVGSGVFSACRALRAEGFEPDVMVAHSGWGSSYFLRDAFPQARLLSYFEWYYNAAGADVGFDPQEPVTDAMRLALRTRNAVILNDAAECDWSYTPTRWQASQFPAVARARMSVLHDGVDTGFFIPAADKAQTAAALLRGLGVAWTPRTRLVTWAGRGMEPYRGFVQVMEALPAIVAHNPDVHVLMVGEDRVCYGRRPPSGSGWKQVMLERIAPLMPAGEAVERRIHFTGALPYGVYKTVLQASDVHMYLTRPFVLSWSMLEAMSCGALLVGSDTQPVREVLTHGENGFLVPFFAPQALADTVCACLDRLDDLAPVRARARETVTGRYALARTLPAQLRMLHNLAEGKPALDGLLPVSAGRR